MTIISFIRGRLWKTEEEAKTVEENNNKLPLDTLKKQAQANINSGNPSLQQKGKKTLDRISYIKSQTVAAHIMRPQFNPTANGFMKIKGTVVSENLRYDPYSKELYLKEPKGFIEKSATAIDKITDLYNKYLEDANNLINNAVANDSDVNADYVADALDIIIEPRSVLEDIPEEEKPLTSDETYAESRELNKDLFEPLTATASVSSSTPIAGASLDYSKYSIGEDLDNAIKADERVAAQMGEYDTNLGAGGEAAFSVWRQNLPKNLQSTDDYDLRGFYKKYGAEAIEEGQHLTDEFKKPNHPTFSKKSKYYKKGMWAGEWDEDGNFIIPLITPKDRLQELIQYWKNSDERGVILVDNPKAEKELEKTEKEISKYTEQLNDEHESEDTKRLIRQELKKLNMKRNSLERQIIVDTYNE